MKLTSIILIFSAVAFGVARLFLVPVHGINFNDTFKDMAHLYVGVLFGVGGKILADERISTGKWKLNLPAVLAVALTVLETVAAITRKVG